MKIFYIINDVNTKQGPVTVNSTEPLEEKVKACANHFHRNIDPQWEEDWPRTFTIFYESGNKLGKAEAWICSDPVYEVKEKG